MVRGRSEPCRSANGEYVERQGLAEYLAHGYVPLDIDTGVRNANSIYGNPECGLGLGRDLARVLRLDDFAIAQFAARAAARRPTYPRFMKRSGNWRSLFDRRSGMIEPRYENGSFPANTTTCTAAASSREIRLSTAGWSLRTRRASSMRWVAG